MWYRYLDDFRRGISVFAVFSYGIGYPLPLCPSHIDHDVLTAHCRASSGDSVDFLSQTICTITVAIVIGVSQTSFMVGGFNTKRCWHCDRKKLIPRRSAVVEVGCQLLSDCRHPRLRNLNSTVPVVCYTAVLG